jgi:hypothetical protein
MPAGGIEIASPGGGLAVRDFDATQGIDRWEKECLKIHGIEDSNFHK